MNLFIPPKTKYVIDTLNKNGYEAYIVGGCVRDMLLNKIPNDFDVATSAYPQNIQSIFPKTIATGIQHGTVTVIADGEPVEVTTYRTDGVYSDFRRPDCVKFVSELKDDLARRDFTVNAMAYNDSDGLCDFFGGQKDLNLKLLKAVGNPEIRFREDALRILRLFRFSSSLSFKIEAETFNAAIKCSKLLENVSCERIWNELKKTVCGQNTAVIKHLISCGGLKFTGIEKCDNPERLTLLQNNMHLRIFAFLYICDCDIPSVLTKLKASNEEKNYCEIMEKLLSQKIPETKADIKNMLNISTPEILKNYFEFIKIIKNTDIKPLEARLSDIFRNNEPYKISDLNISGRDIENLGFKGKDIGFILEELRTRAADNPDFNKRETLLKAIVSINKKI